jgi:hypothetical protein
LAQNPGVMVMMAAVMTLAIIYLPTEMVVLPAYYNLLGDPEGLGLAISVGAAASIIGALGFEQIHKRLSLQEHFADWHLGHRSCHDPNEPFAIAVLDGVLLWCPRSCLGTALATC